VGRQQSNATNVRVNKMFEERKTLNVALINEVPATNQDVT